MHLLSGSSITVSRHHAPKCLHVTSSHPGGVLQVPRPPSCSVQASVQCIRPAAAARLAGPLGRKSEGSIGTGGAGRWAEPRGMIAGV